MSDIPRNNQKKIVETSKQSEVPVNEAKDNQIQIHFGNAKIIEIKLLESINKHLSQILIELRKGK